MGWKYFQADIKYENITMLKTEKKFALDWIKICIQAVLLICTLCKQNQNKMEVQK